MGTKKGQVRKTARRAYETWKPRKRYERKKRQSLTKWGNLIPLWKFKWLK